MSGDCFAHDGEALHVRAALDTLRRRVAPVTGPERVPLLASVGRCLAEPIRSPRDVPAFDNAAVDGWAFAHAPAMLDEPTWLTELPGRAAAGHPWPGAVPAGHALRILTGAMLPAGADTVALQEAVTAGEGRILIPAGLRPQANHRRAGEDIGRGAEVLPAGTRLGPHHIGVAAELGCADLPVRRPLEVAVFSTGDELTAPGRPLPPGGVYDANRFILLSLLQGLPVRVTDLGIIPDDEAAVRQALGTAAATSHVILTSGGASRGDEDHVVRGVASLGRLDFWRIAIRPGRPLAFGSLGDAVFIGLPGNPVAALVCFLLFARPALLRLAGAAWTEPRRFPVPAGFAFRKKPDRSEYLRGRLERTDQGLRASRIEREGSGILTSMTEADGLIELGPAVTSVNEGEPVPFLSFAELGLGG